MQKFQSKPENHLQRWLKAGFLTALLLLFGTGLAAYKGFQQLLEDKQRIYTTYKLLAKFERVLSQLRSADQAWQGYLMTEDPAQRSHYQQHRQNAYHALVQLEQTASSSLQPVIADIEQEIDEYFQWSDRTLISSQEPVTSPLAKGQSSWQNPQRIVQLTQQNDQFQHQIQAKIHELSQSEFEQLQRYLPVTDQKVKKLLIIMGLLLLLSLALLIGSYYLLHRQFTLLQSFAQQQEQNAQRQFNHILDRVSDAFVSIDRNWNYTYLNPQAGLLLLRDPQSLVGKNLWDDFPEKLGQPFYQVCHEAMETRQFRQLEEYEADIDRWFDNRIYPTPDGLSIFFQDVTDRKLMELALRENEQSLEQQVAQRTAEWQQLNQQLLRSNQELETYAYVTSHDLREPLRAIIVYTQLLQEEAEIYQFNEDALECMHYIIDGASRMQQLIQDLLCYSRVGTQDLVRSQVDVQALLDEVLHSLQVVIRENNAIIQSNPLPKLYVDELQLKQILQNLIDNAVKFRGKSPPVITIQVKLVLQNHNSNTWQFSVRDNGIGIKEPFLSRIFDIFRRLNSREKFPGTGMGLAICKKIVERHQGEIWAESQFGVGTTFHFTLVEPIAPPLVSEQE
ncbi:MAG: ATP-binding protein [Synechococcales bacterium]|nr:ATP-binding protein [Synechococcales bacterium]